MHSVFLSILLRMLVAILSVHFLRGFFFPTPVYLQAVVCVAGKSRYTGFAKDERFCFVFLFSCFSSSEVRENKRPGGDTTTLR